MSQAILPHISPTHPVRGLTALAKTIALPHEFAPERFPSFPSLERTACMGFSQPYTWSLAGSATDINKMVLFRQPGYPLWISQTMAGAIDWVSWVVYCQTTSGITTEASYPVVGLPDSWWSGPDATGKLNFRPQILGSATVNSVKCPVVAMDTRCAGSTPYMYVPQNQSAVAGNNSVHWMVYADTAFNATTTVKCIVQYAYWVSPGEEMQGSAVFNIDATKTSGISGDLGNAPWIRPLTVQFEVVSGGTTFIVPNSFRLYCITVGGGTVALQSTATAVPPILTVSSTATYNLFPGFAPAEFGNSTLPWATTRTTATAALFTNVTQVLNKGGTVLAGRITPQVHNPWLVTSATLSTLHPAEKQFLGLETGLYTYVPPSTDLADFWDYTLPTDSGTLPLFRLDNTAMCNVGFFTTTGVIESIAITTDWHIEFRISSALFPIGMCTMTLETLHQAQLALHAVGFFFENPDHKDVLSKVASSAARFAKIAVPAVTLLNPTAGMALEKTLNLIKMKTPKATTLEKSARSEKKEKKDKPKPPVSKGKGKHKGNGKGK